MRIPALLAACLTLLACAGPAPADDSVRDAAGLLDTAAAERIRSMHRALLEDLDIRLTVIVLDAPADDLDEAAARLFGREAREVLLLFDPEACEVRMEVGYDLEPIFTDGFVGRIERDQMAPFFAAGSPGPGIEATVELLVGRALDAGRDEPGSGSGGTGSGGAGARAALPARQGLAKESDARAETFGPRPTPRETIDAYLRALELGIRDPDLGLYTEGTRRMLSGWVVTTAQQREEARRLRAALPDLDLHVEGDRAAAVFPPGARHASPYFLRRDAGGWRLDLAGMSDLIAFNHLNQWRFRRLDHEYMFAFRDPRFDRNGFPHAR